jgi:hypothetical protein
MSNSPVGWAIRGVHAPSSTGLWARSCAPCPRGKPCAGALFRVGTARNTGVSIETSVRRLCPPYEEILSSRFFFLFSTYLLSLYLLLFSPIRYSPPRSRGGRSADSRSGASGHPRPAKVRGRPGTRRGCLPPSTEGGAPLGAPPWRFWAGGRASFSGISSGSVQRAPRSQVVVPGGRDPGPLGTYGCEPQPRDATPCSAFRIASRSAPR